MINNRTDAWRNNKNAEAKGKNEDMKEKSCVVPLIDSKN